MVANPYACLQGGDLNITWFDDTTEGVEWKVLSASLVSKIDEVVHWTLPGETDWMPTGFVFDLPGNMPDYVDICSLQIEIITFTGIMGDGGCCSGPPAVDPPAVVGSDTVYVVLADPIAPMATPWITLLDWSCFRGHSRSSATAVATWLTVGLWLDGTYLPDGRDTDPPAPWYTTNLCTPTETFYLGLFLDDQCRGQCNDFSQFLRCAFASQGVVSSVVRTFAILDSYACGGLWMFECSPAVWFARGPIGEAPIFTYHQFVSSQGAYYGGSMAYLKDPALDPTVPSNYEYFVGRSEQWYLAHIKQFWRFSYFDPDTEEDVFESVQKNDPSSPWALTSIGVQVTASRLDPYGS